MMSETDCATCKFPTSKTRDNRLSEACQFVIPRQTNTLIVPNYGEVPVLKGDLSWLSHDVTLFLNDCAQLMTPSAIRLCNGSVFEAIELRETIQNEFRTEEQKQLNRIHLKLLDIGYDDVHVMTKDRVDAEPSNALALQLEPSSSDCSIDSSETGNVRLSSHYMTPSGYAFSRKKRFQGSMSGRTMYVVPFAMNMIGGRNTIYGVQITDDPVLVLHLRSTFRVLSSVWDCIAATSNFIKCAHTIGMPRPIIRSVAKSAGESLSGSFIILKHDVFQVWAHGHSFGRTLRYGKTFSVISASWIGAKNGWLAEPAVILAITNPKNVTIHVCYSSLNNIEQLELKTGLGPGWKIEIKSAKTVWVHWHEGKLHAIAPENDEMVETSGVQNFRNLLNGTPEKYQIQSFNPQATKWTSEAGVPISGYIFANRRHDQFPLVLEANSWQEGVVLAAGIRVSQPQPEKDSSSESGSDSGRSSGARNVLIEAPMNRVDPIHFSFAKYVSHWLSMGVGVASSSEKSDEEKLPVPPRIFFTNLSQETEGKVIWPGGADNAKIFEYIFNRCTRPEDLTNTTSTGLGKIPKTLETTALVNLPPLLQVDVRFWLQELTKLRSFFNTQMGSCLPAQLDKVLTDMAGAV